MVSGAENGGIRLGRGAYPASEAARLARIETQRLRRWVKGYQFRSIDGEPRRSRPLFKGDLPKGDKLVLSFTDLIEVCFVKAFLDHGVTIHTIRFVANTAAEMFDTRHPFCVKRFETDGETIIARLRAEDSKERLLDLKRGNFVFPEVFNPLLKQLAYDNAGDAARWWPMGKDVPVVLDPAHSFGAAVVETSNVPTRMLYGAHVAGESDEGIADWYRVRLDEVRAAIRFEESFMGRSRAA